MVMASMRFNIAPFITLATLCRLRWHPVLRIHWHFWCLEAAWLTTGLSEVTLVSTGHLMMACGPHEPTASSSEGDRIFSGLWTAIHINCSLSEINTRDKLPMLVTGDTVKVWLCKCWHITTWGKPQGRAILTMLCKMSCSAGPGLPPCECLCSCPW